MQTKRHKELLADSYAAVAAARLDLDNMVACSREMRAAVVLSCSVIRDSYDVLAGTHDGGLKGAGERKARAIRYELAEATTAEIIHFLNILLRQKNAEPAAANLLTRLECTVSGVTELLGILQDAKKIRGDDASPILDSSSRLSLSTAEIAPIAPVASSSHVVSAPAAGTHREDEEEVQLTARFATLTPRERLVMQRVVAGDANKKIAADLGVSQRTIEHHRQSVMRKMGARSLAALVRMALSGKADYANR